MRTAFVNKFLFSYFFSSVLSCSPCCRLRKIIRLFITDSLICVTIHLSVWNRDFNSTDLSKPKQMVVLYESGSALADSSGFTSSFTGLLVIVQQCRFLKGTYSTYSCGTPLGQAGQAVLKCTKVNLCIATNSS